jgi:hypothetical protein
LYAKVIQLFEVISLKKGFIVREIDNLLDTYCTDCFLKTEMCHKGGKTFAHRFCIQTCTVGDQLHFLGEELNKVKQNN